MSAVGRLPHVRFAEVEDLAAIHAMERLPGYECLTARWTLEEHAAAARRPDTRYLVGGWAPQVLDGFVLLQPVADPHEGTKIKRLVVSEPGRGTGSALLSSALDWIFLQTDSARAWLDVFAHNPRAIAAYRKSGLRVDGVLRSSYRLDDGSRADRLVMSVLRDEWAPRPS